MNNGVTVWDYEIYNRTSSKNVHTFIWACDSGIMPSSGPNPDSYGCRGLPAAFTHNINISMGGSLGSQVYLGWTNNVPPNNPAPGGAPQYEWMINYYYNYAQVAALYYYYVGQGYSTSATLNAISNIIYGTSYQNSPLANWLVLYGNMNLGLP
jgi:hypothetical protein